MTNGRSELLNYEKDEINEVLENAPNDHGPVQHDRALQLVPSFDHFGSMRREYFDGPPVLLKRKDCTSCSGIAISGSGDSKARERALCFR